MRGFGSVDIGPLALAQFHGQLSPSFLPQQYFQAGYSTTPQAIPLWDYADPAFASQLAGLLGGSVVQAPPPGNLQGTGIPPANWVQTSDGTMILPGDLFQPGSILSFQDECDAENYFVASIPGAVLSSTCAGGGTGLTPAQMATQPPPAPVIAPTPISTAPVTLGKPSIMSPGGGGSPAIQAPGVPASNAPPSSALVTTGTPGSSVNAATGSTPAASSDIVVGGFDLSQVPWYWWLGGAAVLAFAFGGKR